MAGGLSYANASLLPVIAAYTGAYAADQTGYAIGKFARPTFRRVALARSRRRQAMRRAIRWLETRGILTIAASRFLGPIAWITPPLAGSVSMPYGKYALGSLIGVLLGVGQFLLLGWFGAWAAGQGGFDVDAFMQQHFWRLILVGQGVVILIVVAWRIITAVRRPRHSPPAK